MLCSQHTKGVATTQRQTGLVERIVCTAVEHTAYVAHAVQSVDDVTVSVHFLGVFFVCLVKIYEWIFVKHYQYTGAVLPRDIKFKLPDVRFLRDDISSPEIIKRADVAWIQTTASGINLTISLSNLPGSTAAR